ARGAAEGLGQADRLVVALIDLQRPRHVGLAPVELLVEIVAQPADALRERDARGDRVAQGTDGPGPLPPEADVRAERAERDRAPDPQTAVHDVERLDGVLPLAEVAVPVGGHVVEASAHEPERDGPQGGVQHHALAPAARDPALLAPPHGHDDPEDDAQRVRADRQRAEVPHALRRTRDHDAAPGLRTPSASSAVSPARASPPSVAAVMRAEPTITPSA